MDQSPYFPDNLDRLTLLERAQQLHDATLRRHGAMLDRHEDALAEHAAHMARLDALMEAQQRNYLELTGIAAQLATTVQAIKDMLERGNGH